MSRTRDFGSWWNGGLHRDYEPLGVIDIGSNSVRLVVYEGAVRAPVPLFNEKVLCGLGRTVASTGQLPADAVARALNALARFRMIARILRVKNLRAIATAAVREAENGPDFLARGEHALGIAIQILSGEREAELAAAGIVMGFGPVDAVAGDLGGGSLELIDLEGKNVRAASSLPLGGLRLIDMTGDRLDRAVPFADEQLGAVPWLAGGRGRTFYAVGGTWRSLARLHMEQTDHPLRVMHGYRIAAGEALGFLEGVRKRKLLTVPGIEEVSKARRETLPYGALVLERLIKRLQPSEVVFSVYGIREGLIYSLLPAVEQAKDPLLTFCADYARLRSRSVEHARELCGWTDRLFGGEGLKETDEERRLRHAACLVSDIGWRAHPDYRGEQSLNVIAHAALAGVDHPGRAFLALAVYFRHVGPHEGGDAFAASLKRMVDRRALKRARIIGAAIRVAHMMSIGMPGIIDEIALTMERERLILTLPRPYADLDGERLQRRFASLCELTDREPVIRRA